MSGYYVPKITESVQATLSYRRKHSGHFLRHVVVCKWCAGAHWCG